MMAASIIEVRLVLTVNGFDIVFVWLVFGSLVVMFARVGSSRIVRAGIVLASFFVS